MKKRTSTTPPPAKTQRVVTPTRGKLKPMRVSMGFREFVLDQLGGIDGLQAKPMFGGIGLYSGTRFFGIVAADVLYLKVDDTNRRDYVAAGSTPFEPFAEAPPGKRTMSMSYYAVPAGILENAPTIIEWARRSIEVARTAARAKAKKTRRS